MPLVPQVVDAVSIPVLAAGGIGDARGFIAALALGAVGVQMGTRFMATAESDLNAWGRAELRTMAETDTVVSRAMTGATVRCIRTAELEAYEAAVAAHAPDAKLQELKRAVRSSRNTAKTERRQSAAGQIAGMINDEPTVAELIDSLIREAEQIATMMPGRARGEPPRAASCRPSPNTQV